MVVKMDAGDACNNRVPGKLLLLPFLQYFVITTVLTKYITTVFC